MLKHTRIKICGMTQPEQVKAAVNSGVDAIGVILYANSPRMINLEQAHAIRAEVPAFVSLVGVFVDADKVFIENAIKYLHLDLIQLHGDEGNEFGLSLSRPFVKAVRAKTAEQVSAEILNYPDAAALLFDPYVKGQHGGTGQTLDCNLWPHKNVKPLILAGGLSAINVAEKIRQLSPYAVDLNSGLEDTPGVKNIDLICQAIRAIRGADDE